MDSYEGRMQNDLDPERFGTIEERVLLAAGNSDDNQLRRLLNLSVPQMVNCQEEGTGDTPLHKVLKNLIALQDPENRDETTPFNEQVAKETLSLLKKYNPNLNIANTAGETAIALMQKLNQLIVSRSQQDDETQDLGDLEALLMAPSPTLSGRGGASSKQGRT